MPPFRSAPTRSSACPPPGDERHDDQEEPVERANDIVKGRHLSLEHIGGDRNHTACEPGANQRPRVPAIKEAFADSAKRIARTR